MGNVFNKSEKDKSLQYLNKMRQGILDIHKSLDNFEYNKTVAQLDEVKYKARKLEKILDSYKSEFIGHADSSDACLIIKGAVIDAKHLTVSCDEKTIDEIKNKFKEADDFLEQNQIKLLEVVEARIEVPIPVPFGPGGRVQADFKKARKF
jgi:hypothetical protein